MVGGLAQTRLCEAFARAVVEENAIFLTGPDGIGPELPRSACLEKQAARLLLAKDDCLIKGCQAWLQAIVIAQDLQDMLAKFVKGGEAGNFLHGLIYRPENKGHALRMERRLAEGGSLYQLCRWRRA